MRRAHHGRSGDGRRTGATGGAARGPGVEPLEGRVLLSVASPVAHTGARWTGRVFAGPTAAPTQAVAVAGHSRKAAKRAKAHGRHAAAHGATAAPAASAPGVATPPFTPAQLRHFYGVDSVAFGSVAGTGAGQTIAIIDANNQPSIRSDLATFDSAFGLPAPPSFVVEGQDGSSNLPGTTDDGIETSLDVEWAHAFAPGANLLLIECNSLSSDDLIRAGVATANATAGVSVVSMSFGFDDFSGESFFDSYFTHPGITYVASTGDTGSAHTGYPSTSPDVLAVGGTTITAADSAASYGSETVWNDPSPSTTSHSAGATGGGISVGENKPAYQSGVTQSTTKRTVPDVSLEADPNTGVFVKDSEQSTTGYLQVGGTSLSAPCWAGLVAQADQGRATIGQGPLTGSTQTLPRIYQLPSADFHDVTVGNNNFNNTGGFAAGTGYDLATGFGTPVANRLVPDLAGVASTGTVTGRVFQDNNANGAFDGTDTARSGQTVFLDANNDGVHQSTEPTATTDANGLYTFTGVAAAATGSVRLLAVPTGFVTVGTPAFTVSSGGTSTANLGLFPTAFTDAAAGDTYTVRVAARTTTTQILVNGTVAYSAPSSLPPTLSFTFSGSGDALVVDDGFGSPVANGGISLNGTATSDNDTLTVLGTTGNDTISSAAGNLLVNGHPVTYANVPALTLDPRAGTDAVSVNSGTVNVPAQAAGGGFLSRTFSTLSIASGARLVVGTAAARSDRTVLVLTAASALSVTGTGQLDLGGNDLVVRGGALATVTSLLTAGYANGTWAGVGAIASAAAAGDTTHRTALGVMQNSIGGQSVYGTFDGQTVATTDVLVKYTYYGDATLDGLVNAADYGRIDGGFLGHTSGWGNGDFNYDAAVDGSDYTLIDNAFNTEAGTLVRTL